MTKVIAFICLLIAFFWQPSFLTAGTSFPLETIYAQTDKKNYFTGENIWFRAFLVNSQTHIQDTLSRFIYAELINEQLEIKDRVMIRHDESGVFAGHFLVTDNLEAGTYLLRFFTRHIEPFGEEFFFTRTIHIITPQSLESPQPPESPSVPSRDFTVSFHPEGGDIPADVYTRIAFKALNTEGLGEDIRGVIVNQRGDTLARIQSAHLGMGSFVFRMNRNEQFYAIVHNPAGVEKRFALPQAQTDAIALQVFRQRGNVVIGLSHDMRRLPRQLYITIQHRGEIIYSQQWNVNSEAIVIAEDHLPTGVIGITLTDSRGIPISQRQIFNQNRLEVVTTTFTTDKETYGERERVNASIEISDSNNRPLNANFSISVIDNDISNYDTSVNILSHLLLSSDLRGHIENPAYYFTSKNEHVNTYLDLVMLTHGWSRFEVNSVFQEERFIFEESQVITGILERNWRRIPGLPVTLLVAEYGFFEETVTDSEGRFRFENFEFPEGTGFLLQGSVGTAFRLDETPFPAVNQSFIPIREGNRLTFRNEQHEETTFDRSLLERLMQIDDGVWSLELDEFVVRGFRPIVRDRRAHLMMDLFARGRGREELASYRAPNMEMLAQMAFPGIIWPNTTAFNPENNLINGGMSSGPTIVLDGIVMPTQLIRDFDASNVEAMFRSGSTIFIFTYNVSPLSTLPPHIVLLSPLGYQIAQEFFSPAYTTQAQRENPRADLRTTIYWNPNVTTNENGIARLHFYTSDHVGNYVVVIEGVTDEGRIVHTISRIR